MEVLLYTTVGHGADGEGYDHHCRQLPRPKFGCDGGLRNSCDRSVCSSDLGFRIWTERGEFGFSFMFVGTVGREFYGCGMVGNVRTVVLMFYGTNFTAAGLEGWLGR
jgi:hypothetical protein